MSKEIMKQNTTGKINIDEAIVLLTKRNSLEDLYETRFDDYIDEYGNYVFYTDMVIDEPNFAYGSPESFSLICKSKLEVNM